MATRAATAQTNRFEMDVSPAIQSDPLSGRLVLVISKTAQAEPRLLIGPQGPAMFAIDLEQLPAGGRAVIDQSSLGYPGPLGTLPPGEYTVQAVINVYNQVRRADGHTVWLPTNDGTQEFFSNAAGHLYSEPQKVRVGDGATIHLTVSKRVPPATRPTDTEWVKYVTIESRKLSQFWGRPTFIHATVLLPKGYSDHPTAKYPTVLTFGHNVPFSFTTGSTRVRGRGTINTTTGLETGYDFHRSWTADGFPRFIAVSFEQQTPFFPDSYSLNSVNSGPYGDAMIEEVIPFLEQRFRMIAKPYARLV
ncbi:MAG TPA: hypothetical protein VGQ52_14255 [Gemmatimonadaceae bacterium]|nr:hypothetical protein [Gemmatimonadaceae bacterium]